MTNQSFQTSEPSQIKGLEGYTTQPLFTVGETINDYVPPGILDGTGAYKLNDTTVRILVNHETNSNTTYAYTLASGVELTGARISYFDVDIRTFEITDSGLAYDTIYNRAGQKVTPQTPLDTIDGEFGLDRFCAANLIPANEFGNNKGVLDNVFLAGEETSDGTQFALDVNTNELWALPWFSVGAWESATQLDTGTTNKVAFILGDDRGPAPLYLYVGTKGVDYNNDGQINFVERNGLTNGKVYVWVANDANLTDPRDFNGTGNTTDGKFVEIDIFDETGTLPGYDSLGFARQVTQDALVSNVDGFLFSRPEDVATNPNDGSQMVFASTGRTGIFNSVDTWGTTYIVDVDFSGLANNVINAELNILYDGNDLTNPLVKDFGLRSPDNLEWADNGLIYLQEDRAISANLFGATSGEEASIWRINPNIENPAESLLRIGQIDRTALPTGQTDPVPNDIGNWESSGIVDVSTLFGNQGGDLFIFDVQAHSIRNGSIISNPGIDTNGNGTVEARDNLVEGGQLSLLIVPNADLIQNSDLVFGSNTADEILAGVDFDAVNDIVFTGAGNDEVDVPIGGAVTGFNRIDLGSGTDRAFAGDGDSLIGGTGNDSLDATDADGSRLNGGDGDDLFFLGKNGRALGGNGNDKFFVAKGGSNTIAGGAGSDQFWLLTDTIPTTANRVIDFTQGVDVIGIANQPSNVNFDSLIFNGNNIAIGNVTFAVLSNVNTSTLTVADFAFV